MNQPNLLKLARQGNADAIATLMNEKLRPRKIEAKVQCKPNYLYIVLETKQEPDRQELVGWVHQGLLKLGIQTLSKAKITAKQKGYLFSAWQEEVNLNPSSSGSNYAPVKLSMPEQTEEPKAPSSQSKSIKDRARAGDRSAITYLLDLALYHKKMTTQANLSDRCLQVIVESDDVPDRQVAMLLISRQIAMLKLEFIETVSVLGKQIGVEAVSWSQDLALTAVGVK
jgi:hypothetical protein